MRPHPGQPRQQVLTLGQFDLRFRIGRGRTLHENIENQTCPVVNLIFENPVEVAQLRRSQFVVENHVGDLVLLDVSRDLGQFTLADERFRRRVGQPLSKPFDRSDPGRLGQKLQFVEVFHGLPFLLLIPDHRDQHGFAGGNYRFVFLFHKFKKGASPRGRNTLPRLSRTRLNLPQIYKKYRRKKASARFFRYPVLQILKICLYLSPEEGD